MDDLYRENIIDHYKNPRYRGHLEPSDIHFEDDNPLCGDHIEITLRVDDKGFITDCRFDGKGCAISQASADLLMESIIGKSLEDVKKMTKQDVLDLLGIELGPVRLKCALLSLKVLKAGAYGLQESNEDLIEQMVRQGSMKMNFSQLSDNELEYFEIAPCSDLPEGERLFLEIGGMKIVIINIGEKIVAIGDLCTHDQGPLGDGEIDHEEIVCPRHGARFNILTGKATSLPAVIDIPTYRIKIVDEMIQVGIPKTGKDST